MLMWEQLIRAARMEAPWYVSFLGLFGMFRTAVLGDEKKACPQLSKKPRTSFLKSLARGATLVHGFPCSCEVPSRFRQLTYAFTSPPTGRSRYNRYRCSERPRRPTQCSACDPDLSISGSLYAHDAFTYRLVGLWCDRRSLTALSYANYCLREQKFLKNGYRMGPTFDTCGQIRPIFLNRPVKVCS